jgi:DNA-binding LacI/PurR family transcriptional regulator
MGRLSFVLLDGHISETEYRSNREHKMNFRIVMETIRKREERREVRDNDKAAQHITQTLQRRRKKTALLGSSPSCQDEECVRLKGVITDAAENGLSRKEETGA